jgi:hypothetical protein
VACALWHEGVRLSGAAKLAAVSPQPCCLGCIGRVHECWCDWCRDSDTMHGDLPSLRYLLVLLSVLGNERLLLFSGIIYATIDSLEYLGRCCRGSASYIQPKYNNTIDRMCDHFRCSLGFALLADRLAKGRPNANNGLASGCGPKNTGLAFLLCPGLEPQNFYQRERIAPFTGDARGNPSIMLNLEIVGARPKFL